MKTFIFFSKKKSTRLILFNLPSCVLSELLACLLVEDFCVCVCVCDNL